MRAVIFDFDGTLVDSEPNYFQANRALLAQHGIPFDETDNQRYVGASSLDMMHDFVARHGLPGPPRALVEQRDRLYLAIAEGSTRVFPGMLRFLDLVQGSRLPVAVASGSSLAVIRRLLAVVGLADRFDQVLSAEQVARGKPAPDVFLEAARRLRQAPRSCVVVEDSAPGVAAAFRAGMRCIAVPERLQPSRSGPFRTADLLFPDGMAGFDPDRAFAWIRDGSVGTLDPTQPY